MAKAKQKRSILREMIVYGMVGVVSTAIDMGLLNLSHNFMGKAESLLWLATAIGFLGGTVNGYFMNSRWTFRYNTDGQEAKKFSQFAIVSLVGLGLTEIIVLSLALELGLSKNVAKLIAVAIIFFWNYGANKMWTFKK